MKTAVALGNFDGVHLAHKKLIENVASFSRENGVLGVAYVFCIHPRIVLGEKDFKVISQNAIKEETLIGLGLDKVIYVETTQKLLATPADDFVKNILCGELGAVYVAAGFNYRFGAGGKGNAERLRELSSTYGFAAEIAERVICENETVSSSSVRTAIENGDLEKANCLMVRPFTIRGTVSEGRMVGRRIGFPTANIEAEKFLLLPKNGVYMTETIIDSKRYKSVTNVGVNPTVGSSCKRSETHIIDFSGDLYGRTIDVIFKKRIRDEKRFESLDALSRQIAQDIESVKMTR